jgi:ribosomal protein S18 acetylase RimI-like enzyme
MDERKPKLSLSFGEITEKNIGQLKILNSSIFPVKYNEKFYSDLLQPERLTLLVYHNDILIGAVCCRVEAYSQQQTTSSNGTISSSTKNMRLYIMTLGVLAPYRNLGIGKRLLEFALKSCEERPFVDSVYLHVQTSNYEAIQFYQKHGFLVIDTIKGYYKRIEPPDCYVLSKSLKMEDAISSASSSSVPLAKDTEATNGHVPSSTLA